MLNIIRSILRQIRKDKLLSFFGVYLLLMVVISFVGEEIDWDVSGSDFSCNVAIFLQFGLPMTVGIITTRACGADLRDKTANYEVLLGKKRWEVYLGRFIPSLLVSLALTAVIAAVPVLSHCGESMESRRGKARVRAVSSGTGAKYGITRASAQSRE